MSIVATPVSVPDNIRRVMNLWRKGLGEMPESYIAWQLELAQAERARLEREFGLAVLRERLVAGGDSDGMREAEVVAETRSGRLLKLRWCDSNQGFMVDTGHGQTALFPKDLT